MRRDWTATTPISDCERNEGVGIQGSGARPAADAAWVAGASAGWTSGVLPGPFPAGGCSSSSCDH